MAQFCNFSRNIVCCYGKVRFLYCTREYSDCDAAIIISITGGVLFGLCMASQACSYGAALSFICTRTSIPAS
ncbi:hypothetical protein A8G89_21665 [Salmonella enterica]|nr:hypothetical protein AL477_26220 [Shigella sonnei]EAO2369238.1 hypothetical protein [Salmonella enterica]EDX9028835.1 hypothetical protein [Salmonella enterica subsp. enterica serovar 4,[5],12:i:-]EFE7567691.1 hypothetical protein [Escherichia coli]EAQ4419202.1 hypothetical protein [Salmonella enterica]